MELKKTFSAKIPMLAGLYAILAAASLLGAFLLRFDFGYELICKFFSAKTLLFVLAAKLFFLALFGQFKILLKFFHNADVASLFWAFTSCAAFIFAFSQISIKFGWVIPRGVILIDYFLSIISFSAARMFFRSLNERSQKYAAHGGIKKRVAIIGAGDVGSSVAENLIARKSMGVVPVVFLDEDPKKIGGTISGLSVLPLNTDFKELAREFKIDRAIVAISKISRARLNEITSEFSKIGIETSVVPSYHDLTMGYAKISDIRKVSIEEVLGRKQIPMGSEEIDNFIKGKTVLVTGAGGSIGSELCRQIAMRKPACLAMLDQCEVQLFNVREDLSRGNFGISLKPVIGNVADAARIGEVMAEVKPQIIFHAAAHKHVPIMEYQAGEALKNNVLGTWNTALAASANGAEKFVLISTDKAVNPSSVMGASKRLAEILVQAMQNNPASKTKFAAVRFGNVLGSSGSVIPIFKRQIAEGGPLTITPPDVMRYFMSIPEAAGLVLQCGAQSEGGEIFVLDMGEQIKITDLARQMISLSGLNPDTDIKIEFVGLRPGEKISEELHNKNEKIENTKNPKIFAFVSAPISFESAEAIAAEIRAAIGAKSPEELKDFIRKFVPEYTPQRG